MNLRELSEHFSATITKTLDSKDSITAEDVEKLIGVLAEFGKVSMDFDEANLFMHEVAKFVVFLNNYSRRSEEDDVLKNFTIRKALGAFTRVVDKAQISEFISKKFRKVIDVIIPALGQYSITKEFLRVYSHFMDSYSPDILSFLASKHSSFTILYNLLKDTCDIETQAVILEVVLKFCKYSDSSNLNTTFLEVFQLCDVSSALYPNIRMILDHLNENSPKIFSINCTDIELNSRRVVEFEAVENLDDIWLDLNLIESKISFFCTKKYAESISKIPFPTLSTWEVLSFYTKDILQTNFNYNSTTENLIISFIIKTSKLNLFVNATNKEQLLEICISRYSDRFPKLINEVLPLIFPDLFCAKSLNIFLEKDNSLVANDLITERFYRNKKLSVIREVSSPIVESDQKITVSDDESDQSKQGDSFFVCKLKERQKVICSIRESKKRDLFNKSSSPVSFTESLIGKKNKSFRCSTPKKQNKTFTCKKYKKLKVFTSKKNTKVKPPSSDDDSSIIGKTKSANQEEMVKELENEIDFLENEERIREPILNNSLLDNVLNDSNLKVSEWLQNKVDYEAPIIDIEEESRKSLQFSEEINTCLPPSVSARNSQDYANLLPEKQLKMMMADDELTQKSAKSEILEAVTTSGDLLKILNSQEENNENHSKQLSCDSTGSSDIPLVVLAKKIQQNANEKVEKLEVALVSQIDEINVESVKRTEDDLDPDRTLDLDEILRKKAVNKLNVSVPKSALNNSTINKRKLYNPGDYSYINESITDDYIKSRNKSPDVAQSNVIQIIRSGTSKRSNKKNVSSKQQKAKKSGKHLKKAPMKLTKQDLSKKVNQTASNASLKEFFQQKIDERKEANKISKKLFNSKKGAVSSSSSSSMEPFGSLIRKVEVKRKSDAALAASGNSKRLKGDFGEAASNAKIRIISDVLIQPGKVQASQQFCCLEFVRSFNNCYLEFVKHLCQCQPHLLQSEGFGTILNVLNSCRDVDVGKI